MRTAFGQALSLCLAWVAAIPAESAPVGGNLFQPGPRAEVSHARAHLAPLWLAAPVPAGPGAAPAELYQLRLAQNSNQFHLVRFRGRIRCGAPGRSSSRFLPATERSPFANSRLRFCRELTDLRTDRWLGGRGRTVRGASGSAASSFCVRAVGPTRACILSVSSSLYQPQ
jgi:hypothetical protein